MSVAPSDRIDQAIDSGLAYVPGDPVLVHVVQRGHRYLIVVVERMSTRGDPPMVPRHAMANHLVDVDGDRAHSRTYLANGSAVYTCEHERTAEGWRIRTLEVLMFA